MSDQKPTWCVMVAMANPEMTEAALSDLLAQSIQVRVLLVLQGVDPVFRDRFLQIAEQEPRLLIWDHNPALPSLSATWNRALQAVWGMGGTEALVVNNDVRLYEHTVVGLLGAKNVSDALFVSAVGVTQEQFAEITPPDPEHPMYWYNYAKYEVISKGGPDFSCFLISKACHDQYPFDEQIIPAFTEDLDLHRRMMLGGDGDKIFSINLPYLHIGGGSQTLKSMDPEARAKRERQIDGARAYYTRKWGGGVNQERFTIPFEEKSAQDGVTTPELQRAIQGAGDVPVPTPAS
jgi:hypothetical protein